MSVAIQPLMEGRNFGVRVCGLTFEQAQDEGVQAELRELFEKKGLVIFEDVEPSGRMHVAISNVFGPLKDHPSKAVPRVDQNAMPGVIDLVHKANEDSGRIFVEGREVSHWLPWHFDHAYNNELNRAGVLRAIETPSAGGLTGFLDGIELWLAMPEEMRVAIQDKNIVYRMNVIMNNFHFGAPADFKVLSENPGAAAVMEAALGVPRAIHPAVWRRGTGETVLHISPWMAEGIEGDETEAGNALLEAISREIFAQAQALAYYHTWKPTDMVIWDNWRVLHAVSGHDPREGRRMQRTTIKGDYGLGRFENGATTDNKILERTY